MWPLRLCINFLTTMRFLGLAVCLVAWLYVLISMQGDEHRVSQMLGKFSTTELYP